MSEAITALAVIQSKLKAPKGQVNSFGKYKYRSCEDIVEAVKPLLAEHKAALIISDDIILIGERYYVKATVTLQVGTDSITVCGFAREAAEKKGMDVSQVTGAASSYSRKYALNGMFAIDDTKDADTKDNSEKPAKPKPPELDENAYSLLKSAKDMDTLQDCWRSLTPVQRNSIGKERLTQLKGNLVVAAE